MKHRVKAPSTGSALRAVGSTHGFGTRRRLFGLACLCTLALAAFLGSGASSAGAVTACPNEAFRLAQHATQLPDCRAFEKVSPADKGLGDIIGDGFTTLAAEDGEAVTLSTRTPFGDTVGSATVGQTQYLGRRSDGAWAVHAITPSPRPDAMQTFLGNTTPGLFSNDLRTALWKGYDLPDATDDAPLRGNIYAEDTATGALKTVGISQVDPLTIYDFINYPSFFWGVSADARHIAFVSDFYGTTTQFLPNAAPGVQNVYQWDDGTLSVAGILPNGTVPAGGSTSPMALRGAMSADGSRLLFYASAGGNPQLFMRVDGSRTIWISQPELDPSDPQPDPNGVEALGMTPDGRTVFFTTDTGLVPGDTNGGTDLYRYTDSADPAGDGNLTRITEDGNAAGVQLMGMSDDGERVYYFIPSSAEVVAWGSGTTRLVSSGVFASGIGFGLNVFPGHARVTPDGMFLAFLTDTVVDSAGHGLTGELTKSHLEMYLYSLSDDTLKCVSCPPWPATSNVTVVPETTEGLSFGNAGFRPRYLSDSGRVFFSTTEALVPEDTNGVFDAYEYDAATGQTSLLSSGRGNGRSTFADASANGGDVFITTRQQLVPSDTDELVDLYDVRVGGGFDEPLVPPSIPCHGEDCQGSQAAAPGAAALGSKLSGVGNPSHRRCGRGKRKVRRKGKVRCVRQKRHANNNRRAGR